MNRFINQYLIKLVAVFVCFQTFSNKNVFAQDIIILKERLYNYYLKSYGWYQDAEKYLPTQSSNGSWRDIDYNNHDMNWKTWVHLSRINEMSLAYNTPEDSYYHSEEMLNSIIKGIEYWYQKKPYSDNWIYNDIIPQQSLMPILILMEEHIPRSLIDVGLTYFKNPDKTGANMVWLCAQTIHRGVFTDNMADILLGIDSISSAIVISKGEGIKPDYSFHQHKEQLYNAGYGLGFTQDIAFWINITNGLSFSFNEDKVELFIDFVLNGTQWMTYRTDFDFSVVGRTIAKNSILDNAELLIEPLEQMLALGRPESLQIRSYIDHIKGARNSLIGNKHFWYSDYHSHRRKNYAFSVKMWSDRTIGGEGTIGENTQGYYLSCGATYIASRENSYLDIAPVWDWCRIPGTTSPHRKKAPSMPWPFYGKKKFAGGVSDGIYGVSAMELEIDSMSAKKAWFFFDDEIVALGAGISSSGTQEIYTSLNQCLLRDNVYSYDGYETKQPKGLHSLKNVKGIFHDSIGYVFPSPSNLFLKNESQNGRWSDVNATLSNTQISKDVFSIWINHGIKPTNSTYQYIIMPGIDKNSFVKKLNQNKIITISNNKRIQAVRNDSLKLTGIVFFQKGELEICNNFIISVDTSCILLLDEKNASISASNPLNTPLNLNIKFWLNDELSETISFNFPNNYNAGKSQSKTFNTIIPEFQPPQKKSSFIIYPNPNNGRFQIKTNLQEELYVNIEACRLNGIVVYKNYIPEMKKDVEYDLDLSLFGPGIYILRMKFGLNVDTKKIIIY
jgi:chondroitin AC lyase